MPALIDNQISFLRQVTQLPNDEESSLVPDESRRTRVDREVLTQLIRETSRWSAADRLSVYQNAYALRLRDCLREEFCVLRAVLGDQTFDHFVAEYIRACPPSSYTLGKLGAKLPEFLRTTRPERTTSDNSPDWADCISELADFEWVISEVFDSPGTEQQSADDARSLSAPQAAPSDLRFQFAPCLRLRAYQFPVHELYSTVREGAVCDFPVARPSYVAVTRQDYTVRHFELSETEYSLLRELASGRALADALEFICEHGSHHADEMEMQLQEWFTRWTQRRFLTGVFPGVPTPAATTVAATTVAATTVAATKPRQSRADCPSLNCYCGELPW